MACRIFRRISSLALAVLLASACASLATASDLPLGEGDPDWAGWTGSTEIESPDPRIYAMPAGDPEPPDEKLWSVSFSVPVYVWWPDFNAEFGIEEIPVDVNLTHRGMIDLILNDLSGYLAFMGGVRYDRFAFDLDVFWAQFKRVDFADLEKSLPHPFILDMSLKLDFLWIHPSISYTLIDRKIDFGIFNRVRLDALMGFRYAWYRMKAKITESHIESRIGETIIDDSEHYWTYFPVGAELEFGLLENVSWLSRIMIGGWNIGSSAGGTDGYAVSTFRYHMTEHFTFDFGVKWQDQNMEGDLIDFRVDNMWGPVVGLVFHY